MRQLGQLEAAVMQHLWGLDHPALVREVLENISHDRPLAYTTVLTVLDNLHSKGLVQREKVGKAYAYAPVSSREEHTAAMLQEVLAESDDRTVALMHLVGRMESEEAAELLAALTERANESSVVSVPGSSVEAGPRARPAQRSWAGRRCPPPSSWRSCSPRWRWPCPSCR